MPDNVADLTGISDPIFKFKTPDGAEHGVDPFVVDDKLRNAPKDNDPYETIRAAFGLQTAADAGKKVAEGGIAEQPLSPYRCLWLSNALQEFVEELDVTKKLNARTAKLLASTARNPVNGNG